MEKRQFGHRARLALAHVEAARIDAQAHAARAMRNQLHDLWTMTPKCRRSLSRIGPLDGNHQTHDGWLTDTEKTKLLRLEQRAARRRAHRRPGERTSRRLHHIYDRIHGLRARAKRRHQDWQHKTATTIADTYGTVVVEQLQITNMVRSAKGSIDQPGKNVAQKAGLNRSISDEAWGRTVSMLAYKTARRGGTGEGPLGPAGRVPPRTGDRAVDLTGCPATPRRPAPGRVRAPRGRGDQAGVMFPPPGPSGPASRRSSPSGPPGAHGSPGWRCWSSARRRPGLHPPAR